MTTRYYLTFIFLCVQFLTKAQGETVLPDSLFDQGNYERAALEYERLVSVHTESEKVNDWRYNRARCFKMLGIYTRAQVELSKISYWNLPDSLVLKYRYETALCDYLAGSFTDALFQTEQINPAIVMKTSDKAMLALIEALSHNELMDWDKAYNESMAYAQLTYNNVLSDSICKLLAKCYQTKNLPRIKSEKKANVLRMLPGLGQAYAGSPIEGLFNFTLNLGFLSFGAFEIFEGYYLTGYFVGAIGLNKVYFGGHARTGYLLEKHNYEQRKKFCEKIKSIIINEKAG
jgi:hypothetical protein